ncbi:hypothetical protein, partial [Bacteroides acidifaciens]|uniref:hypothetical protein n=1 Tax=Bacteroides acidifaciens TaxID=85831 RepID=UPI0025A4E9F5
FLFFYQQFIMSNQAEQLSTLINRINKKLKGWRPALKYLYDNDDIIDEVLKEINHFIEQLKKFNGPAELIAELEELIY